MERRGGFLTLGQGEVAAALKTDPDKFEQLIGPAVADIGNGETGERLFGFLLPRQAMALAKFVRAALRPPAR